MMKIDVPPAVKGALLDALSKGNMSIDHARLIASISTDFSKSLPKSMRKKRRGGEKVSSRRP